MTGFKEIVIESWPHFFQVTNKLESLGGNLPYWSFRGQSNSNWDLTTSLSRILNKRNVTNPEVAVKLEMTMTRYFWSNSGHYPEFAGLHPSEKNIIFSWTLMQHYGAPTRLLDWTDSPLIALYYAVESQFESDGAVYIINNREIENSSEKKFGKSNPKTFWEYDYRNSIVTVLPAISTKRSYYQQGIFTVSHNPVESHKSLLNSLELNQGDLLKLIIPKELKIELLKKLRGSNIRADILYPDAFGLGKELANLSEIRMILYNKIESEK